jgi:hypothetical protein
MQVRSRSVAAITALLFVACGVLASYHEATTAHVRDRAGTFVHAGALAGHHAGRNADVHGQRDPHSDTSECALLTASHQAASPAVAAPALAATVHSFCAHAAEHAQTIPAVTDVYRFAPKTSPPRAA